MKFITILQIYVFGTIESTANLIVVYFLPSFLFDITYAILHALTTLSEKTGTT